MKKLSCLLVLLTLCCSVFALELELGFQWDTFNGGNGVPGFNFRLAEKLSDNFEMEAVVDNLYQLDYNTYCSAKYLNDIFYFKTGFLFAFRDSKIYPGFLIDTKVDAGKVISLSNAAYFAFSANDLTNKTLIDLKPAIQFHHKNSEVTLSYNYKCACIAGLGNENIHYGELDILAFEEEFPFKIGVFVGAGGEKWNYDQSYFDMDIDLGGQLIFDFSEKGCYILKAESEIFRYTAPGQTIPFAVSASAKFELN